MQKLFHVNPAVFDPRHDRECELQEGYLHRAYMLSALRSFAWTLADYCEKQNLTPGDINYAQAHRIVEFAAENDWLNYDGETYCRGLCGGSDFHVYFVPDSTAQTDRESLLPCEEDLERVRKMKERFSSYNKTLPEVHSLDALRKDLTYIYPAVRTLADRLAATRDNNQPLLGNDADIVYAWCALALAAKGPFFSEDGPMRCFFSQIQSPEERIAAQKQKVDADSAQNTNAWMKQYGSYVTHNPEIVFEGKLFVFSGLDSKSAEKDHPIVKRVAEKGGQYRTSISGRTDYLVVNPAESGVSQINAVIAQREKGKIIRVILLEDLEKALEDKPTVTKASKTAAKAVETAKAAKPAKPKATGAVNKTKGTRVSWADCSIDAIGTLTSYNGSATEIILPDGIREIGGTAFFHEAEIASVIIPEGVEMVGDSAFWGCSNLKTVVLPGTLKTIGTYAFCECEQLASILIPEGVESIEENAFWGCSNLKTVELPSSLKKIGENAFRGCNQLASIVIPDGCEEIGEDCFDGCEKMKDIFVPASVREIGHDAFFTSNNATVIHIVIPEGVEVIESGVFSSSDDLKTIILPDILKLIGNSEFLECLALVSIVLPTTLKTIGDHAFANCHHFSDITIPEGIETIGNSAFEDCSDLVSIVLPTTLKTIGGRAFANCTQLSNILIPEGIETIGDSAFFWCEDLKTVILPGTLKIIGDSAFSNCIELSDIIIPEGVETIGDYAFDGCSELVSVVLPTTLKTIGDSAFASCIQLSDILIPEGIETIGNYAFEECSALISIVLPTTLKTIGFSAFAYCSQLSNIIIPEAIEVIEDGAFLNCLELKSVILPDSLKIIGEEAFRSCEQLAAIVIPDGCETIGDSCFMFCAQLKDVFVPESVRNIGNDAFGRLSCATVIHTLKDSTAEAVAKEWHLQVEYDYGQTASNVETVSASEHIEVPAGSINEMEGAIHNLSAQSTETASPDFCKHDSQPLVRENGSIERATELQKYSTIESGMERAGTYLYALVKFSKHDDFLTTFTFPGRFDIDITPENQPFFNWQTSNSPSAMTGETDGLAEVINFSCAFTDMISSQKVGGLYDALVMVFPETYDSRYNDLIERINAQMENDCADVVLLVALNFKSGAYMQKSCLLDYRTGTCETVDAEISAADAEIAKKDAAAFMEETLEQQYAFSERQTSLRLEAEARKRREEEARQRKEAEERKAEYDDLVRRKAEQEQIVAENQGGFLGLGKKAKLRREAMSKIEEINEKLKLYPEFL